MIISQERFCPPSTHLHLSIVLSDSMPRVHCKFDVSVTFESGGHRSNEVVAQESAASSSSSYLFIFQIERKRLRKEREEKEASGVQT